MLGSRTPIDLPRSVPQPIVDAANEEARRRIVEAYDTGMRQVSASLREMLAGGWKPDRESVAGFCDLLEKNATRSNREVDSAEDETRKLRVVILSALDCLGHDDVAGALRALRSDR